MAVSCSASVFFHFKFLCLFGFILVCNTHDSNLLLFFLLNTLHKQFTVLENIDVKYVFVCFWCNVLFSTVLY